MTSKQVIFKIRFFGGLGDCLKMLTEQTSLYQHYQKNGLLIYWVYSDPNIVEFVYERFRGSKILNGEWAYIRDYDKVSDYNTGHTTTVSGGYPVHQALYDLLIHFPFFQLVDQNTFAVTDVPELNNYRCNNYPSFSESSQLKGLYENEQGGWKIELEDEWVHSLLSGADYTFCVQLSGSNSAKKYDAANYVKLFKLILGRYPSSKILLIDRPNYIVDPTILFDDRIINLVGKASMIQCARIIQEVDYLIAPDSYSKYLRKWVDKKQIILCAKLDCHPDPKKMLEDAFNIVGLCDNIQVSLLGVQYLMNNSNIVGMVLKIVDSINDISPEEIFDRIKL